MHNFWWLFALSESQKLEYSFIQLWNTTIKITLLQGPPDSVLMVMDFITEKIMEKPDPTAKPAIDFDNKICAEREKQIKVIVPNSTAGMIIGKGGSFIKVLFSGIKKFDYFVINQILIKLPSPN